MQRRPYPGTFSQQSKACRAQNGSEHHRTAQGAVRPHHTRKSAGNFAESLPRPCQTRQKLQKICRVFLFDLDACGCAHATRRRRVRPTREVVCRVPLEALTADDSTTGEHPSTLCMLLRSGIANFTSSPTGSQRWSSDSALAQGFPHAASIRCPLVFADPCPAYGVH